MPSNCLKVCPRCKRLFPDIGRTYCPECDAAYRAERSERRRATRDWAAEYGARRGREDRERRRFYKSGQWRQLARWYEQKMGHRCEECGALGASDVHHVVPIQTEEGWLMRLSPSNLRLLCVRCHNREHRRFGR